MLDLAMLAQQCAPRVNLQTLAAVVSVESGRNPYAIGVVDGHLVRQPQNLNEAVATAEALEQGGWNFSVGLAQVNKKNLEKKGVSYAQAFDTCRNLKLGAQILTDCYQRAKVSFPDQQAALRAAFSCYYSGNFTRGFQPDKPGAPSYVAKVVAQATGVRPIAVVPAVTGSTHVPAKPDQPRPAPADHASVMMQTVRSPEDRAALDSEPADHAPVLFHRAAPPAPAGTAGQGSAPTPATSVPADSNVRHVRVY